MITDDRGKVPNFVFDNLEMIHQPTGIRVAIISGSDASLRLAHQHLLARVTLRLEGSVDVLDTAPLPTLPPTQTDKS